MNAIISFNLYSDVSYISSQDIFHQQNAAFRSFVASFISFLVSNMTIYEQSKETPHHRLQRKNVGMSLSWKCNTRNDIINQHIYFVSILPTWNGVAATSSSVDRNCTHMYNSWYTVVSYTLYNRNVSVDSRSVLLNMQWSYELLWLYNSYIHHFVWYVLH